jgi:hypothetical protein
MLLGTTLRSQSAYCRRTVFRLNEYISRLGVAHTSSVKYGKSHARGYPQRDHKCRPPGIVFALFQPMIQPVKPGTVVSTVLLIAAFSVSTAAQKKVVDQIVKAEQPVQSAADKATIKAFQERVGQYLKVRDSVKAKAPKLAKDSTPEQIQAAETAYVVSLRAARADARQGSLFTPDVAQYIRTTLKRELSTTEKKDVRKTVLDKETNIPVALKVNYPYPDPKEFVEMPAKLLLKLPELPKEVKYRYVGRTLLLLDTDSNLILDYMPDALA